MFRLIYKRVFLCENWFINVSSTVMHELLMCRQLWSMNYKRVVNFEV